MEDTQNYEQVEQTETNNSETSEQRNDIFIQDDSETLETAQTVKSEETDESDEGEEKNGKTFYTNDEMRSLDWSKIDTSRIPPELQPFYKSMQASYTKKRQSEVEELRKLAKTDNNQSPTTQGFSVNEYTQAFKKAQEIVQNQMPGADELDPAFVAAVQGVTNEIVNAERTKRQTQAGVQNLLTKATAKYGADFAAVDNAAQEILFNEYPASVHRDVMNALQAGNYSPINAIMDEAYKRVKNQPGHVQSAKKLTPPNTIGAGSKTKPNTDATKKYFGF